MNDNRPRTAASRPVPARFAVLAVLALLLLAAGVFLVATTGETALGTVLVVVGLTVAAVTAVGSLLRSSPRQRDFREGWQPHQPDQAAEPIARRYRALDRPGARVSMAVGVTIGLVLTAFSVIQLVALARATSDPLVLLMGGLSVLIGLAFVAGAVRLFSGWTRVDARGLQVREVLRPQRIAWADVQVLEENRAVPTVARVRRRGGRPVNLPGVARGDLPGLAAHLPRGTV